MSNGALTGSEADWPSPAPSRATNICRTLCTAPVSMMITDQIVMVMAISCLRDIRSDSDDIGIAPMTNKTPVAPPIAPNTASEMCSVFWMSGASTLNTPPSMSWSAPSKPMIVMVRSPPMRTASLSDMASSPTPGQIGVSEQHLRRDRRFRPSGVLFEDGGRQRRGLGRRIGAVVGFAH